MATYNNFFELFDNIQQFTTTIESRPQNQAMSEKHSSERGTEEFTGTKSYEHASELLQGGDAENLERITRVNLPNKITSTNDTRTRIARGVAGCIPNVPAHVMGLPKAMMSAQRQKVATKVVNIVCSVDAGCDVTSTQLATYGANVASLVNTYELMGMRCNVFACSIAVGKMSNGNKQRVGVFIKIKDAKAPLNKLRIAYPLINPSMLRRHGFKWLETCPATLHKDIAIAYGGCERYLRTCTPVNDYLKKVLHGEPFEIYSYYEQPKI